MAVLTGELRTYLHSFDFQGLFVEGLGWNFYHSQPTRILVEHHEYVLEPVAEKAGFAVYVCNPSDEGNIPAYPVRRKIELQVAKMAFEHLIIFIDAGRTVQVWQWIKREVGKPAACREYRLDATQTGTPLLQRLNDFLFTLDDESKGIVITDVTTAVSKALDVEKVTKRFYDRFRKELIAFQKLIEGIDDITAAGDREWYASLMLNRMMFVYFIQKQGFLDGDVDYLRNRLRKVQEEYGTGLFQEFYRDFLVRLFHEGLGQPESKRKTELHNLLGQVPYLNGGLFDVHDLEQDYTKISIPDEAFERIFNFFDDYRWHLDERPRREDNEINPDVLGYIFEKYINQKQMGAYYTKEDITGYITRNTIIPFLLDSAKKECPTSFDSDGVWRLLRNEPDRYIYTAAGHGTAWTWSPDADPVRLEKTLDLPEDITAGLDDVSQRSGWNLSAPPEYALPTETWRELIARRQRYQEVRGRMVAGGVSEVNDLITLNLDIERFAKDVIAQSEGPELLWAFWKAIKSISVLDPTCGSGAFLFAALNILEPLYTTCLEGMRGFVDDMERTQRARSTNTMDDFRAVLQQVDKHPNQRYFILKSIILNNLYGVDIMEEAVEICKLRLFLKMVAQLERYENIEPLPDIDFNIRAGNTLVGFTSLDDVQKAMQVLPGGQSRLVTDKDRAALTRINKAAKIVSQAFDQFRSQQTNPDGELAQESKITLRSELNTLRDELDGYLAAEYDIDAKKSSATYDAWRDSHRPFHWFVEFYGILVKDGFDIVIGNPPYLEFREADYKVLDYKSSETKAIHALCIERSVRLIQKSGRVSMIVPISITSTSRMKSAQQMIEAVGKSAWYANFAWRPGKLFDTVNRALTIFANGPSEIPCSYSTGYIKWTREDRTSLFERIVFSEVPRNRSFFWIPKLSNNLEQPLLKKILTIPTSMSHFMGRTKHKIFYRTTGGLYWKIFTDFAPAFYINGKKTTSSRETSFNVRTKKQVQTAIAVLSSDIFWWWYTITSNLRDLNPSDIRNFPIPDSVFTDTRLVSLGKRYTTSLIDNSTMLVRQQKQTGRAETQSFKVSESKHIINKIDQALAKHYGFTTEELDFIINYDIKYRMRRRE